MPTRPAQRDDCPHGSARRGDHAPLREPPGRGAHAEGRVAAGGRSVARLDCLSDNPRLRTYYEAAGYRAVGEEPGKLAADGTRYGVTLMERSLTPGPAGGAVTSP
ncbi:hypothetical protein [Streptomyces sp. NPDC056264]|uniref:hypothetical protein n=1 Tax=Streptomyces sp. NPDC056264 TaxID=3345767 RepID=UPI003AAFE2C6